MSGPVIIRLQNLPLEARSIDIRRFFEGLLIPDGGVHIIGGERGDAFIAFQSDEDARQAMGRDNQPLCGSLIKLYLSSKTEMQNVIASARQGPPPQTLTAQIPVKKTLLDNPSPQQSSNPMDLLSKYMSGGSQQPTKREINVSTISQLTNTINPNILDQLKNINQIIPNLQTFVPPPVAPKPVEQPKPNMSIDQILKILESHLQPPAAAPQLTSSSVSLNSLLDKQPGGDPRREQLNEPDMSPKNYHNNHQDQDRPNNYLNRNNPRNNNRYNPIEKPGQEDNTNGYNRNRLENGRNSSSSNDFQNYNRRRYDEIKPDVSQPPPNNNNRGWVNRNEEPNQKIYDNSSRYQNNNVNIAPANAAIRPMAPGFDPIIRVRNFNTNCSYKDVRTFLQGIQIEHDGIKLLTDHNQQRNGSAFVKLLTITDLKKALCRNKQFYEDKNIVVTQSSEAEFNAATNFYSFGQNTNRNSNGNSNPTPAIKPYEKKTVFMEQKQPVYTSPQDLLNETEFFLKIYGLPVKFDENELKSMFNNVKFLKIVTAAPTPITSIREGTLEQVTSIKAKKICQVETQLDLERALTRQDERVGKSKLQIYQISRQEYDREMAHAQKYGGVTLDDVNAPKKQFFNKDNETDTSDPGYLNKLPVTDDVYAYMSGVPFSAREHDVRQFFYGIDLIGVLIIHEPHTHKPTGEVCCHFGSKFDCDRALDKNEHLFRNRIIKINPIDYNEYYQYALKYQVFKKMEAQKNNGADYTNGGAKRKVLLGDAPGMQRTVLLATPNGPEDAPKILDSRLLKKNDQDYPNFNSNSSHNSFEDDYQEDDSNRRNYMHKRNNGYNNYDNNSGPNNLMGLNTSNNSSYHQNKRRNYNDSYGNNDYNNSHKRSKPYYNDNGHGSPQNQTSSLPPLPAEFMRYRNRLILLSNISYDASRENILDLVSNYSPLENTLKIRHDDMGKPAGDAVIAFESSEDANQAVNMLDGSRYMGANVRATLFQS